MIVRSGIYRTNFFDWDKENETLRNFKGPLKV
jgi:hypothetical protein